MRIIPLGDAVLLRRSYKTWRTALGWNPDRDTAAHFVHAHLIQAFQQDHPGLHPLDISFSASCDSNQLTMTTVATWRPQLTAAVLIGNNGRVQDATIQHRRPWTGQLPPYAVAGRGVLWLYGDAPRSAMMEARWRLVGWDEQRRRWAYERVF